MNDLTVHNAPTTPTLWERVTSLFVPQFRIEHRFSPYEGDPDRARKERPLRPTTQTRWYLSDVEAAIVSADQGDMRLPAKLSRSLRRDGVLGGILSTRTGGLTRLPKQFRGTERVIDVMSDESEHRLFDRIFPSKELALLIGDGILLGVGVGELLQLPDRPEPVFVRLDPEFLRYRWSEDRWYYASIVGEIPITPGDGRWILHMPGGYQQPWSNGLWSSLARAYVAKDHAFNYRENYSGKLANPARVAYMPGGATDVQKQGFFEKLMAWGLNTVFGLPPGWEVKLIESNGQGYDVFQATIDSSDKEFMVALAGQIVTITGGAGFANADIHATIRSDLIQDDGDGISSTLNDQAFPFLVSYLFGCGFTGSVAWDTTPPGNLASEAAAITAAATAIKSANDSLAAYGMRIDAREIATRFKIPVEPIDTPNSMSLPAADNNDETSLSDDASALLAAKMTEHGVTRCEHGSSNRCRLCGVERVRDFVPGEDGNHAWSVAWRPIPKPTLSLVRNAS